MFGNTTDLHIALVNRWYPPHSGYGGVAMYQYYLSRALVRLGHKVTVLAARWSHDAPEFEVQDGVKIHRLLTIHRSWPSRIPLIGRFARALTQLIYSWRVAREIYKLEKKDKPDVIEFAEVEAEGFAYLFRKRKTRVVVRCHTPTFVLGNYYSPEEMPYDVKLTERMEKYCIRQADLLTTPSQDMAGVISEACSVPVNTISVIPNPIDVSEFQQVRTKEKKEDDRINVLCVGRLDRLKGIEILAKAIPEVMKENSKGHFIYAGGDGRDAQGRSWKSKLEAYFEKQQVQHHVEILGDVDQKKLLALYAEADIAVVPSLLYESFSYTCAQAMAAGVPVVASCIGGVPETVEDGISGALVAPGNPEALAQAILCLARDSELRKGAGEAGKIKAKKFGSEVIAKAYLELLHKALSKTCD